MLFSGGDKGIRTPDLLNAIQALSQLSYIPVFATKGILRINFIFVKHSHNSIALIPALISAGLSMFQPVIPYMNISVSEPLSSGNSDLSSIGVGVLLIAVVAVICGAGAVLRKDKTFCAGGLVVCGGVLLLSAAMFLGNPSQVRNLPFSFMGMAMSKWMETVFVWALCYIGAAVCAYLDDTSETDTSSAPANSTTAVPSSASPPSPEMQTKAQTFEPVLGVETPALIKRALLFLEEDDFNLTAQEVSRLFRQ